MLTRLKAKSEGKLAKQLCRVVLDQFDKQYSKELGDSWSTVSTGSGTEGRGDSPGLVRCSWREIRGSAAVCLPSTWELFNPLYSGYLLCNEYDRPRGRWLRQTLESFIPQPLIDIIKVSELDGREMGAAQPASFDKVLVDAPCSNDRSWLFSSDSQKAAHRIHHRNSLPVLQVELLRSAIQALRPGGLLVYSTCTLSKAENQDVISEILTSDSNIVPVDISGIARTFSQDFTFAPTDQKCSLLVIPVKGKAWGPMYIAKLKKGMDTGKWQGEFCKPC
ncbi:tRNA (cytosine(34)-C(5))-methyltransferase, mitochondrial isoform X4 [Arvicanthis niloticus]|uniref:tRNA (cytosine(34)-C(5))-methyltransferase, mitochondrial isoform X4 n=1 Tax=Arvicanthis niloticus TaxID=61156 RepID=UPI00402BDA13